MRFFIVLFMIFSFVKVNAFTVKETVEAALANNANILSGREDVKSANARVDETLSEFLPDVQYQYSRQVSAPGTRDTLTSNGSGGFAVSTVELPYSTTRKSDSLVLSQNLFAGGAHAASYLSAKKGAAATKEQQEYTTQQQTQNAIEAHIKVLNAKAKVKIYEQSLAYLEQVYKAEKEKYTAGVLERTKLAESEQSLYYTKANLANAKRDLKSVESNYEVITGVKAVNLEEPVVGVDKLLALKVESDKGEMIAQKNNPAIKSSKQAYESATYGPVVRLAEFAPKIGLQLSSNRTFENGPGLPKSRSASLNVTVPIFSGGDTVARYKQSKAAESKARIQYLNTKRAVKADVESSFKGFLEQQEAYKDNNESLTAAKIVLEGRVMEYNEGLNSLIELLRAQNDMIFQENRVTEQKYSLILSYYSLLLTTGNLTLQNIEKEKLQNEFLVGS